VSIPDVDPEGTKKLEGAGAADAAVREKIPAWKELIVAVAGPLMNLVLAVVLAVALSLVPGVRVGELPAVIGSVIDKGPAARAGLRAGDVVRAVGGHRVDTWTQMQTEVQIAGTNATEFLVSRDGRDVTLRLSPERDRVNGACFILAVSVTNATGAAAWMPARNPLRQLAWDAGSIFRILKGLVTPKEAKATARALGGPVMIAEGIYRSMRRDVWDGIGFLRFLNVNLAVLNLLPIPVLDGGLILFSLIALVFRRRLPEKLTGALSMVFMYLLMGLMGVLILKDTVRSWKINTYRPPAEAVNRAATNQLDKAAAPAGKR
jgi:regulator of sigma E protease